MFPNPQDALPLPPRPSLERYRRLAKELVKACKSGRGKAMGGGAAQWLPTLQELTAKKGGGEQDGRNCTLADAQFVIARWHGFQRWPKFAEHLEALPRHGSFISRFEAAANAIVNGDTSILKRLLREEPTLIHATSMREHGATLLHYVAANGVENYRQMTPPNIVEITETLLNAGAEIDATANVYGGGSTTLGLAATSIHPEKAGVQEALLRTLLDRGASLSKRTLVMDCLANGRAKAAEYLVSRGAHLDLTAAAALGRLDVVQTFFDEAGNLRPGATAPQLNRGFLYACEFGRNQMVEFLLEKGVDVATQGNDGQTGLHWAAIGGHLDTVQLLLRHNPPLEVRNMYDGTVFGQAAWSAAHGGDPDVYLAILQALAGAGAKIPEVHLPVNPRVDEWLAEHGSRAEPG